MNRQLADQFQAIALPELLEDCLEEGHVESIAFNRWGTILAAGLKDGRVVLWDMETRGVARTIPLHSAAVTTLAWSRDGHLLLATAADGSAKLWGLASNALEGEMSLGQHITSASMSRADPRLCLVSFPSIAPALLDFREERSQTLPCLQPDLDRGARPMSSGGAEGVTAIFSRSGRLVFMALANGSLAVLSAASLRFVDLIRVPGGSRAVSLALSRDGASLVINHQDRLLRALEVLSDDPEGLRGYSLPELRAHLAQLQQVPAEGSLLHAAPRLLRLAPHSFQDAVDRPAWQAAAFTRDCEHLAAVAATKDAHRIHLWTRAGRLERILQGPNVGAKALAWHPRRSLLATVAAGGAILLWACVQAENWSAFAPGFTELQENEEYVEPEDVFDVNPKPEAPTTANGHADAAEASVDILTEAPALAESSDDEGGPPPFVRVPVEIEPQEFDERGQLVQGRQQSGEAPAAVAMDRSPEPRSREDSGEPAISEAADSARPSVAAAGGSGWGPGSEQTDQEGVRLQALKQKRCEEPVGDSELLAEERARQRLRESY